MEFLGNEAEKRGTEETKSEKTACLLRYWNPDLWAQL